MTEEKWVATDDQTNGPITSAWEFIDGECQDLQNEIGCPRSYIAGMLRAIADNWDGPSTKEMIEKGLS